MATGINRREFVGALTAGAASLKLAAGGPVAAAQSESQSARVALAPVRVNPVLRHPGELRLRLEGEWQFRLDPDDKGLQEGWYKDAERLSDKIHVPGCWQGQGFGNEEPEKLWECELYTRTLKATYTGTGWYAKRFELPAAWRGKRLWLNFGGVHPSAEVWLNGVRLGENGLPFVPFGFEITDAARLGAPNLLAVRVHEKNREFGLIFSWQGNWSGLYRDVEVTATGENYLERLWLRPDVDDACLRIKAGVGGKLSPAAPLSLKVSLAPSGGNSPAVTRTFTVGSSEADFEMSVPSPKLWCPESPNLYRVDVVLQRGEVTLDALSERTGFVKFGTAGKHFLINGEPYYMRGSGDFISCPETGSPDSDRERWRRKLKTLRDYGYNYVRCQSYIYTPEYFEVADEVGLIVQSEMGMIGALGGHTPWHVYQWPKPTPDNYPILKRQWDLCVERDVNHPSANMYNMSNEYGEDTDFRRIAWECYHATKAIKPTAQVIWTDGGYNPELPGDFVNAEAETDDKVDKPLIQHEFRWWSSFPDVRLIDRYNQGAVRPYAAEMARQAAAQHGQTHLLEKYADRSAHLQLIEAKAQLEMCRRDHPRLAGICHFDAVDLVPSPQGVLNDFYEQKLVDAPTWRQTFGDTVLLSSLQFDDRVWVSGETRRCSLLVSDFSHPPFATPSLAWSLVDDGGTTLTSGTLKWKHEAFRTCPAGEIEISIPSVARPTAARLAVRLVEGGRSASNQWSVWLFPEQGLERGSVAIYGTPEYSWLKGLREVARIDPGKLGSGSQLILTERLDEPLLAHVKKGGNVLLVATEGHVRPHRPNFGYVKYFFTPPANYPPFEDGQNGTLIAAHPMLDALPHDNYADLQFFRMIDNAPPLDLEPFGLNDAEPVIRVIHRYMVLHPLAYLLERSVGNGRLIVCALELDTSWPEARYLLNALARYARQTEKPRAQRAADEQLTRLMAASALP